MVTRSTQTVAPSWPVLSFDSTVSRRYVHRQSVAEVFLTDCASSTEPNRFFVGAQWPRLHGFYRSHSGRYDTMLLAETLRQTAIYLAHTRYRVPLRRSFVMQSLSVTAEPELLAIGQGAAEVVIDVSVSNFLYVGEALSQFTVLLTYRIDGGTVGTGIGVANVLTPASYARARWGKAGPRSVGVPLCPSPIPGALVGRVYESDVVLGPQYAPGRWLLRIDDRHPILFDHPSDHIPGMLILEALRQGAHAALGQPEADSVSLEVEFHRFAELDQRASLIVVVDPDDPWLARGSVVQWGVLVAEGTVRVAPDSPWR